MSAMKRKAVFIGHGFHNITRSSSFFQDIIEQTYNVYKISIDPDGDNAFEEISNLNLHEFHVVFLWQIDWLASYFLSKNIPTVVLPMYDGSSTLEDLHWLAMREALIVNFSLDLHNIVSSYGCNSVFVKYFPKVFGCEKALSVKKREGISAFFWERRPDSEINLRTIAKLLAPTITHLHLHRSADPGTQSTEIPTDLPFTLTVSTWFENREEYLAAVAGCEIYVAPRYTEGIGMSFLEAMSMGRVVVAHDAPTHSEYISNFDNGILFDAFVSNEIRIDRDTLIRLSNKATLDARRYKENWDRHYTNIMLETVQTYIENFTADLKNRISLSDDVDLDYLNCAHRDWGAYYGYLRKRLASQRLRGQCSSIPILKTVSEFEMLGLHKEAMQLLDLRRSTGVSNERFYGWLAGLYIGRNGERS
jgi:hypothetical protein